MKCLKTSTKTILGSAVALALLYGGAVQAQTVKVLSIVDHPALDAIRDGVRDELSALAKTLDGLGVKVGTR